MTCREREREREKREREHRTENYRGREKNTIGEARERSSGRCEERERDDKEERWRTEEWRGEERRGKGAVGCVDPASGWPTGEQDGGQPRCQRTDGGAELRRGRGAPHREARERSPLAGAGRGSCSRLI